MFVKQPLALPGSAKYIYTVWFRCHNGYGWCLSDSQDKVYWKLNIRHNQWTCADSRGLTDNIPNGEYYPQFDILSPIENHKSPIVDNIQFIEIQVSKGIISNRGLGIYESGNAERRTIHMSQIRQNITNWGFKITTLAYYKQLGIFFC